jgi:uncharacterized protein (UPF0332 family)
MKEYDLQKLINDENFLTSKIKNLEQKKLLLSQDVDKSEIEGHILKAENNLRFVSVATDQGFLDWAFSGCYYSCYHAALALIQTRGFTSKNHLATLCIIIKEFYNKGLSKQDIEVLSHLLDYEDVLFYVESKNKREDATYSTKTAFDKKEARKLRIKSAMFVNKITKIISLTVH